MLLGVDVCFFILDWVLCKDEVGFCCGVYVCSKEWRSWNLNGSGFVLMRCLLEEVVLRWRMRMMRIMCFMCCYGSVGSYCFRSCCSEDVRELWKKSSRIVVVNFGEMRMIFC